MIMHIKVSFTSIEPEQQDWVIAHLAEAGYEGFEQEEYLLHAFINEKEFDNIYLQELAYKYQLTYVTERITNQNWNAIWESSFQPVVVEDFAGIRAEFHPPINGVKHEIIITPKMSFGTGHHATTWMMVRMMKDIDFKNKSVLDFGTGTGLLAILADKMGAEKILAIDYDDWSINNAKENIAKNNANHIDLEQLDYVPDNKKFDIILANINRNVIIENMERIGSGLAENGRLLLSGITNADLPLIMKAATQLNMTEKLRMERDNWFCLMFDVIRH